MIAWRSDSLREHAVLPGEPRTASVRRHQIAGSDHSSSWRNPMLAFTHGALNDLQGRYQLARLIMESMPSGFETPDHPSIVVFGKGTQNLGKLVTIFLLRLQGDLDLHS